MLTKPESTVRPIFRDEAVAYARARHHGSVVLATPISYALLSLLFAAFAACIVAFLVLGSYQRKVQVHGVLLPETGVVRVVSSQAGVVVERTARDGQTVKAGDPLFVLASTLVVNLVADEPEKRGHGQRGKCQPCPAWDEVEEAHSTLQTR